MGRGIRGKILYRRRIKDHNIRCITRQQQATMIFQMKFLCRQSMSSSCGWLLPKTDHSFFSHRISEYPCIGAVTAWMGNTPH